VSPPSADPVRILVVGDIFGRAGREALIRILPDLRSSLQPDFVIVNGENSTHGKGINREAFEAIIAAGVDVVTGGNHSFDNKGVFEIQSRELRLLRPANWSKSAPGRGSGVFPVGTRPGLLVGVVNLMGRVHMNALECPFQMGQDLVRQARAETPLVVVDFHAEATSEKIALAWHLDGEATLVFGTHTHVQTADNRVLPGGTAAMTDIGMTGGHDGVIGVEKGPVLEKFLTGMPIKHEPALGDIRLHGALLTADPLTGRAISLKRIAESL
jgi:metallophosphoesterase (TIGR00282 family)